MLKVYSRYPILKFIRKQSIKTLNNEGSNKNTLYVKT